MQFSKKILDALNEQMKNEFYSHNVYLSMAAYFELLELKGFGHWLRLQAKEEQMHALKIFDFILDRDKEPKILPIEAPLSDWKSPVHVFEQALLHEEKVTKMINGLYELALSEKDHATRIFLEWFVKEQVEEEATARETLAKVKMAQEPKEGLLLLDIEFAKRQ